MSILNYMVNKKTYTHTQQHHNTENIPTTTKVNSLNVFLRKQREKISFNTRRQRNLITMY